MVAYPLLQHMFHWKAALIVYTRLEIPAAIKPRVPHDSGPESAPESAFRVIWVPSSECPK